MPVYAVRIYACMLYELASRFAAAVCSHFGAAMQDAQHDQVIDITCLAVDHSFLWSELIGTPD